MGKPAIPVALEIGPKRVFASALDWPGWSRSGRDEEAAIDALGGSARRYAAVVAGIRGAGRLRSATSFEVIERLRGGTGTDFGAPGVPPTADAEPIGERELDRLVAILRASWDAFDASASAARDADHGAIRAAFAEALYARARGELPDVGPRGGARWNPRFGVRYVAWHSLDHAWEIEDRSTP